MRALLLSLRRLGHIAAVLAVHGTAHLVARCPPRRHGFLRRRWALCALQPAERLRRLFEDLGGTFIKFGQMLALQPDILPVEYCNALFKLLDRIEPFPYDDAARIVDEELGAPPEALFDRFERQPIATASIGQVHRAVLDGRPVAVKVQRPDVEIEFHHDVRLMAAAMFVVRTLRVASWQWMLEPMGEFVAWSREELDYRYEARYGRALRRNAGDTPVCCVPRVYDRFTTRRVLVVEYLDGVTLLQLLRARESGDREVLARVEALGFDPHRFATNVVDNFLGDAFRHGVYHADLHPANLVILDDNVVGYVDFGITGVISPYSRRHLVAMSLGLARGDLEVMYREYLKITVHGPGSDYAAFRRGLVERSATWYRDGAGDRRLDAKITRIFSEIFNLSRENGVMPERDIVKYIRSSIAIDGLLARFDPHFDIGEHIADTCAEFLRAEARSGWTSADRLADWSTAAARLLVDGPARSVPWLRGERPEEEVAAGTGRRDARSAPDRSTRRLELGAAAAAVAVLLAVHPPPTALLGANLFTAELAFVVAACLALAGSLLRPGDPA